MDDELVLGYLRRRWKRRLDASSVRQAQLALALPASDAQRERIHRLLVDQPRLWRRQRSYGETPISLVLTEDEKLIARRVADGTRVAEAAADLGMDAASTRRSERMLRSVGILDRGRIDLSTVEGVGLSFHTVRVEGEPAFNVH